MAERSKYHTDRFEVLLILLYYTDGHAQNVKTMYVQLY